MISRFASRRIFLIAYSSLLWACTHPLEIEGQGDIYSYTGERNCSAEEAPCDMVIANAYEETYYTNSRRGWQFVGWQGCLVEQYERCVFNVDAATVRKNWLKRVGPLTAQFEPADSDGDGVNDLVDIAPRNADCDGQGSLAADDCTFDRIRDMQGQQIFETESGLQYLFISGENEILRHDTNSQTFLAPIRPEFNRDSISSVVYSESHQGLYWIGGSKRVYFLADSNSSASPSVFLEVSEDENLSKIVAFDDKLLLQHNSVEERIYDAEANLINSRSGDYQALYYAWSAGAGAGQMFSYNYNHDLQAYTLQRQAISEEGNFVTRSSFENLKQVYQHKPMQVSASGERLLLPNGEVYSTATMTSLFTIEPNWHIARWLPDEELVVVRYTFYTPPAAQHYLVRYDATNTPVERVNLGGYVHAYLPSDQSIQFTSSSSTSFETISLDYVASDDTDGDGVSNELDAFPADVAASIDEDGDGYPDSWNAGFDESDSTSNLSLDAYPDAYGCYEAAHGNGTDCDFAQIMPDFVPVNAFKDERSVVYLHNSQNNTLYRRSMASERYLEPIPLQRQSRYEDPVNITTLSYAADSDRLYVAYADGEIRTIDLSLTRPRAQAFVQIEGQLERIKATDSNLLVAIRDNNNSFLLELIHLSGLDGSEIDRGASVGRTSRLFWNAALSRIYISGNGSGFLGVNTNGTFSDDGVQNTTGLSSYSNNDVEFSSDGAHALVNIATVVSLADYELKKVFSATSGDTAWLHASLISAENIADQGTLISQWSSDFQQVLYQNTIDYSTTELLSSHGTVVSYGKVGAEFQFTQLAVSDADGDGTPGWWEALYGLSDADALDAADDNDTDGLSNRDEYAQGTDPTVADTDGDGLTDGYEVNTSNTLPTEADSDYDGATDGQEVNSLSSNPLLRDTDGDNMSDGFEALYGLDALDDNDGELDPDNDGYSNFEEFTLATDPLIATKLSLPGWLRHSNNASNNRFVPASTENVSFDLIWTRSDNYDLGNTSVFDQALVAYDRKLFVTEQPDYNESARLSALSADTGERLWSIPLSDNYAELRDIMISNESLYSIESDDWITGSIVRRSLHGGMPMLRVEAEGELYSAALMVIDDAITPVSRYGRQSVTSYDGVLGNELWSSEIDDNILSISALSADRLYYHAQDRYLGSNVLAKLDRQTGALLKRIQLPSNDDSSNSEEAIVLSYAGTLLLLEDGVLRAFNAESLTPLWSRDISAAGRFVIGNGQVYVFVNQVLFALNEFNGTTEWVWSAPSGSRNLDSLLVSRHHAIVSGYENTYAINLESQNIDWQTDFGGSLSFSEGKLLVRSGGAIRAFDTSNDNDNDGLPSWWEHRYNLSDNDASDAALDGDNDGLNNLEEFLNFAHPERADSDGDSLSDADEVNIHLSRPDLLDTDDDGLADDEEVNVHITNPNNSDSDDDGYNDFKEVNHYLTDPNDANSLPAPISAMLESFEAGSLPQKWSTGEHAWTVTNTDAVDGSSIARSPFRGGGERSVLTYTDVFENGTLRFKVRSLADQQSSSMQLVVDGDQQLGFTVNQDWTEYSVTLEAGEHTIDWEYRAWTESNPVDDFYGLLDDVSFSQ
ncbi:MAG: PQQ-binding-like beta-propeller repeat protein [Pseudomonadales bacterium]